jgi:hypothetical protein
MSTYKRMHVNMHVEEKSHVNIHPLFLMLACISCAAVHGFPFLIPDLRSLSTVPAYCVQCDLVALQHTFFISRAPRTAQPPRVSGTNKREGWTLVIPTLSQTTVRLNLRPRGPNDSDGFSPPPLADFYLLWVIHPRFIPTCISRLVVHGFSFLIPDLLTLTTVPAYCAQRD